MKVTVIGHIVPTPLALDASSMERWGYRYTRVQAPDGLLVDHVAYLKAELGIPKSESFSVWEMNLASTLLLRARLKEAGHDVQIINYIDTDNEDQAFADIRSFSPDILVLSTTFILSPAQLNHVARILRKHLPHTFVVAGGQHISTELARLNEKQQGSYLKASQLDAFIIDAQGEASLLKLIECLPSGLGAVPNLIWKNESGQIITNTRKAELNNIDAPFDFSGIKPGSVVHLRTARGCAFHCSFCSYPASGGVWALASIDSALAQLHLAKAAGAGAVIFTDDTFNVPKERFNQLLDRMIAEGVNLPWYSFLRCQFIDEQVVEKMKRSGCRGVLLGIESGADTVLANMSKGAKVDFYRKGVHWLKNAGITTVGSFILGFPGETAETVAQTEEFLAEAGLDHFYLQLFYYLHHAPIHQNAAQFGLRGSGLHWTHSTMDWQQASLHMDRLFQKFGARALHQDFNLWEVAFLENRGFDRERILQYRSKIHQLVCNQDHPTP